MLLCAFLTGCAIFRWDIHAPGVLSAIFLEKVIPMEQRIALYLPEENCSFISKNRGGKTADPQTFHVGEAYCPMILEGFQQGFSEFIFMEAEPSPEILKQYAIPYLAVIRIKELGNRVTWKGQALALLTESDVYDTQMKLLAHFESEGVSDAVKVFAKKGGPQVNLNAALENNVLSVVQYLQDAIRSNAWQKSP
jgi:hypothetical protein